MSYTGPQPQRINPLVCPLPRSLATTYGISVDFSSLPYLDVSVQAVPHICLWIQHMLHGHDSMWVSPFRHPRINAHLQLPEAFRSLSRLSSAPSAKAFALRPSSLDRFFCSILPFANKMLSRNCRFSQILFLAAALAAEPLVFTQFCSVFKVQISL